MRGMVQSRGWTVVAEAENGRQAVQLAEEHRPNVAIVDLTMPELNGLDATRQIRKVSPETGVIIFSGHQSEDVIRQVFEAGARIERAGTCRCGSGPSGCSPSAASRSPS